MLAGLGLLVLVGLWLRTWLLHRRAGGDAAEMALEELRTAVVRIGMAVAPGTTLAALERRLRTAAGPDAMRYVTPPARIPLRAGGGDATRAAATAVRCAGRLRARRVRWGG